MQKKVCFQIIFVKWTDVLGWTLMNYLFVLFSHFFLFNPCSVLVRLGLVASKQSSLVANCVRLTFFSGVNVNNSSKYNLCLTACSRFDFNSGFLPIYQRFFAEYLVAKSSFTQCSTIHRVGHCIWESSLNAGFLGLAIFNIRFPTSSGWR